MQTTKVEMDVVLSDAAKQTVQETLGRLETARCRAHLLSLCSDSFLKENFEQKYHCETNVYANHQEQVNAANFWIKKFICEGY